MTEKDLPSSAKPIQIPSRIEETRQSAGHGPTKPGDEKKIMEKS